jgi:hypothetical protein
MDTLFAELAVQLLCKVQWTAIEMDDRMVLRRGRYG